MSDLNEDKFERQIESNGSEFHAATALNLKHEATETDAANCCCRRIHPPHVLLLESARLASSAEIPIMP